MAVTKNYRKKMKGKDMERIDLNCDLGESYGNWKMGNDEQVMSKITSANVACGYHAGDPLVMNRTIEIAKKNNVSVGAHPGYPDKMGFGRRSLACSYLELKTYVLYQIGALDAFCKLHGVKLSYVKPHGKLYLDALNREEHAKAIVDAVLSYDSNLFYVAFAGSKGRLMRSVAEKMGLKVANEAFPDRAYNKDGLLVPRGVPGAVIHDPEEAANRALQIATENKIATIEGEQIKLEAQTLCVHGDTPTALEMVSAIRETFIKNGVELASMATFI